MRLSQVGVTELSSIPNIKLLLLKAALKQSSYDPQNESNVSLPENNVHFAGLTLNEANSKLFHHVVGWDLNSEFIHPCYLHCLAFPLHLVLLLLPDFPLPLLGLVHVDNQIKQIRPIRSNEKLAMRSRFGQLELHPKGWLFSINVEFYSHCELVWQSTSTNFFRSKHGRNAVPIDGDLIRDFTSPVNTVWDLKTNVGRKYASVSGDFNPIHLSKLSAKLFGFKQQIAHGMWTKSNCISELHRLNPSLFSQAFEVNTAFKQAIYLPTQVSMEIQSCNSASVHPEQHFKVVGRECDNKQTALHLTGNIRAI